MNDTKVGTFLKVVGAIAIAVVVMRACAGKSNYSPPDPADYDSMRRYKSDKAEYDKSYKEARDDALEEQINDRIPF